MSITISIDDNHRYCDENLSESVKRGKGELCRCRQNGSVDKTCPLCKGSGYTYDEEVYPFELNVTNASHSMIWHALGFKYQDYGSMDGRRLLKALNSLNPQLLVKDGVSQGNFFSFGIDEKRAEKYINSLKEIALEAARRETKVIWG